MIKIRKAQPCGFCFGVRRAINMAEDALKTKAKIYSLGPIIHNPLVVKELSGKGIKVISDVRRARGGKILIRSHGIEPSIREKIKKNKIGIIDATCPFVERSHRIVNKLKKEGFYIIIVGEKNHPEVAALAEAAGKDKSVVIDGSQIRRLSLKNKRVALLAQSTLTKSLFEGIVLSVQNKNASELRILDTLCSDVTKRQSEAVRLCKSVNLMLVIGGRISANTKRLAEICRGQGVKTYHLESEKDLKKSWFKNGCKATGIISGSSTPSWVVDRVMTSVKKMKT